MLPPTSINPAGLSRVSSNQTISKKNSVFQNIFGQGIPPAIGVNKRSSLQSFLQNAAQPSQQLSSNSSMKSRSGANMQEISKVTSLFPTTNLHLAPPNHH